MADSFDDHRCQCNIPSVLTYQANNILTHSKRAVASALVMYVSPSSRLCLSALADQAHPHSQWFRRYRRNLLVVCVPPEGLPLLPPWCVQRRSPTPLRRVADDYTQFFRTVGHNRMPALHHCQCPRTLCLVQVQEQEGRPRWHGQRGQRQLPLHALSLWDGQSLLWGSSMGTFGISLARVYRNAIRLFSVFLVTFVAKIAHSCPSFKSRKFFLMLNVLPRFNLGFTSA